MPPLRPILVLAAAALACLLPSCMRWHTADVLRDPYTTYTGVDIYHPVDGKVHYEMEENPLTGKLERKYGANYVIAPEVTYKRCSHLTNTDGFDFYPAPPLTQDIRPTGRVVTAKFSYTHGFTEIVPKLPKGTRSEEAETHNSGSIRPRGAPHWRPEGGAPMPSLGTLAQVEEKPGFGRRVLIGTCDYVVDPLLNILTIPVEIVLWPFCSLSY